MAKTKMAATDTWPGKAKTKMAATDTWPGKAKTKLAATNRHVVGEGQN